MVESAIGATTVADQLPGPVGAGLLEPAQSAFTGAMHAVLRVGAALFAVPSVVSFVSLRHVPATGAHAPAATTALEPAPVAA